MKTPFLKTVFLEALALGLIVATIPAGATPLGINYQGYLTDIDGSPVNGMVSVSFNLYTGSDGSGHVWGETHPALVVDQGLFSVALGTFAALDPSWFDVPLYLGIQVGGDAEMLPLKPLLSVGHALRAADAAALDGASRSQLDQSAHAATTGGNPHGVTAAEVGALPHGTFNAHTLDASAHHEKTDSFGELSGQILLSQIPASVALDSELTWSSLNGIPAGFADGVDNVGGDITAVNAGLGLTGGGTSGSVTLGVAVPLVLAGTATGVITANHTSGTYGYLASSTYGVRGQSPATSGRGVYGRATSDTGTNYGVYGYSLSTGGRGVYGGAGASEGNTVGVYGSASSSSGHGIYGYAGSNTATDVNYGGFFRVRGQQGRAVYGWADSTGSASNVNYGGYFHSAGQRGIGVYGSAHYDGPGLKYGGYFKVDSETGYGVYATVNGDYTNYAVRGEATGTGSGGAWFSTVGEDTVAVMGKATGTSGTYNYNKGGHFEAAGNRGYGVVATANGQFGTGISATASGQYGTGIYASGGSDGKAAKFRGNVLLQRESDGATVMELGEGLDYAEGFDVSNAAVIEPGMVMVIDPDNPGKLAISSGPYDTRVAGIVAGAGGVGSGVRLGADQFDSDVALAGRVYCNVDASQHAIEPGDLLTTADSSGYAMKVIDYTRAQGAILGKAMERMERGQQGQILVLVTLQ